MLQCTVLFSWVTKYITFSESFEVSSIQFSISSMQILKGKLLGKFLVGNGQIWNNIKLVLGGELIV